MSKVDFKPFIEWSTNQKGYWLTAPRTLRSKVWDILFDLQSQVVEIAGGEATEIFVASNPGYDPLEALYVLATATHIAQTGDFIAFYAIDDYRKHLALMKQNIEFKGNTSHFATGEIQAWIDAWIIKKAIGIIKNELSHINQFSLDWIDKRTLTITKVRNQLEDKLSWLTQPVLKMNRLSHCDRVLEYMSGVRGTAERVNSDIQELAQAAQAPFEAFQALIYERVEGTYQSFQQTLATVQGYRQEAKRLFSTIDSDRITSLVAEVSVLVS